MKALLYNLRSEAIGEVELPDAIFGRKWNADLVHEALVAQMANARETVAHTKDRSEVSGGGKKPWRQKGTGRARHGSIRSPLWKGGGVTFGPRALKNYGKKINKKAKLSALFAALSLKVRNNELKVVQGLSAEKPKTRILMKTLNNFLIEKKADALLVPAKNEKNIYRASRNSPRVKSLSPDSLNIYDVLKYRVILMDKNAINEIEGHYKL
ncbi:MAG: 50S ribosomal protein L4 [Candidatus Liptonbacteria bacterium]|nr:50S ribosomal protein L4 [Candidatus Liptonbacteria bacterium]